MSIISYRYITIYIYLIYMYIYIYILYIYIYTYYIYTPILQYLLLGSFLFVDDQGCKDEQLYVVSVSQVKLKIRSDRQG